MATAATFALIAACGVTTSADLRVKTTATTNALGKPAPTTLPAIGDVTTVAPSPQNSCIASLTPEEKVGQLLVVLTANPANAKSLAAEGKIGGIGLLENQTSDVSAKIAEAQSAAKIPLAVGSDEEGGTVQRLRNVLGELPSARDSAKTKTPAEVGAMWKEYAAGMKSLGLTMNFGPVLDVGYGIAIKSRAFSDQTATVTEYGTEVVKQTNAGGVSPVVKHWPGLGSGSADPHGKLAIVGDKATLESKDFPPFKSAIAAGVQGVMVTHVNIPDVTNGQPATLSPAAIKILREEQGFKGVIMTDSLGMGAITNSHTQAEAAELALLAGNDVLLILETDKVDGVYARLVDALSSGRITEERVDQSLERWFRMRGITGACPGAGATGGATATTSFERDPEGVVTQPTSTTVASTSTLAGSTTTVAARSSG